jgi:hypothetical protein
MRNMRGTSHEAARRCFGGTSRVYSCISLSFKTSLVEFPGGHVSRRSKAKHASRLVQLRNVPRLMIRQLVRRHRGTLSQPSQTKPARRAVKLLPGLAAYT